MTSRWWTGLAASRVPLHRHDWVVHSHIACHYGVTSPHSVCRVKIPGFKPELSLTSMQWSCGGKCLAFQMCSCNTSVLMCCMSTDVDQRCGRYNCCNSPMTDKQSCIGCLHIFMTTAGTKYNQHDTSARSSKHAKRRFGNLQVWVLGSGFSG